MEIEPAKAKVVEMDDYLPGEGEDSDAGIQDASDSIGRYIENDLFSYYRNARQNEQEEICLACERAYNNKYSMPDQTSLATRRAESGDSTVWVPYTRTKVNIAVAKTYEKMLNTSDNPWSIVPTQISDDEIQRNTMQIQMAMQSGQLQEEPEEALKKLNDYSQVEASEKCDMMEKEIADQMNEGGAFISIAKTVLQQHYLGTGVAKFEITVKTEEEWVEGMQGWDIVTSDKPLPMVKFKSWFNIFFDPYSTALEESNGVIERHVMRRSDLNACKAEQGFDEDKIKEIITNNPTGNHIDLDYETTIRAVNNQDQNVQQNDNYFDVYEAWVELPGDKLIDHGFDNPNMDIEPTGSYRVNCWVCAGVTFKLIMNPHKPQRIPYFVVPYQENTSTINGTGIAEELFGVQEVINSSSRASIDNAAFAHAPITEINVDLLKSGEEPPDVLTPRYIFLREGGDPKDPAIRFYQPTENSGVLRNVYDMFSKIGEDATGISGSTEESMPAANAANMGISMSLSQKNILQRTVVGNIDKYLIKPMIEMYYNFNMKWSSNNDMKVAAKVTANGVTSIIAKEMRSQQLTAFAQITNNPNDAAIVNRKKVLEELATSLDRDGEDLIYSDTEVEENNKQRSEAQQQAVAAEQQSIIGQINAENQGETQQDIVKGEIDMRKQRLIERSKMLQLLAQNEAQITDQEFELLKQYQQLMNQDGSQQR